MKNRTFKYTVLAAILTLIAAFPASAERLKCSPTLVDQMMDSLLSEMMETMALEGPPREAFESLSSPSVSGIEQMLAGQNDPCALRPFRLMKAISHLLERELGEAEVILREHLGTDPVPDASFTFMDILASYSYAALLTFQRRDDEARLLMQHLIAELSSRFGPNNIQTKFAQLMDGDIALAERDYTRALSIYETIIPSMPTWKDENNPTRCLHLISLGWAALGVQNLETASEHLTEAVSSPGPCDLDRENQTPWWARTLRLWGALQLTLGNIDQSVMALRSSYVISHQHFGDQHTQTLDALLGLTEAEAVAGNVATATDLVNKLNETISVWIGGQIATTGDDIARIRLTDDQLRAMELALLIAVKFSDHEGAQRAAGDAVLRFKGARAEYEAVLARLLRSDAIDPEIRRNAEVVVVLQTRLSELSAAATFGMSPADPATIARVKDMLAAAISDLSRDSAVFRQVAQSSNLLGRLESKIGDEQVETTIVEYARVRDRSLGDLVWMQKARATAPKLWLAVTVDREATKVIKLTEPGDWKRINSDLYVLSNPANGFLSRALSDPRKTEKHEDLLASQRALFERFIAPLAIDDAEQVVFSPTADLLLVQLLSLRDEDDKYLAEDTTKTFRIVSSARELLLDSAEPSALGGNFLGIAPVAFEGFKIDSTPLIDLDQTALELSDISDLLEMSGIQTTQLLGSDATERAVRKHIETAHLVHLSTHGFYLNRDNAVAEISPSLGAGVVLAPAKLMSDTHDGVMQASEIQNLDLSQVNLFFVSACESGAGEIEGLEGIHGLPRAIKIAGAKNFMMATRQIDQTHSRRFALSFYKTWASMPEAPLSIVYQKTVQLLISDGDEVDWTAFTLFGTR